MLGWHLHFITAGRTRGGRLPDLAGAGRNAQLGPTPALALLLPAPPHVCDADPTPRRDEELHRAETDPDGKK